MRAICRELASGDLARDLDVYVFVCMCMCTNICTVVTLNSVK
jgi:hypothetical protein